MSDDPSAESGDTDIRRRAAWLLVMLAVVAGLFVILMVTLLGTSGGKPKHTVGGLEDPSSTPSAGQHSRSSSHRTTPTRTVSTPSKAHGPASCPSSAACAVDTDIGNAVGAINAYRVKNRLPAVAGSVSQAAQTCALTNGSKCSGGWAESQVPGPDGSAAVAKIAQLGKLLDPKMTSIEVGWAYNPASKQYFFAIVRND